MTSVSPTLEFLTVAFMFVVRVGVPLLVLFGILYLLKRKFEPQLSDTVIARVKMPLNIHPLVIAVVSIFALTIIAVVFYALATDQFIPLLMLTRDIAVLGYMVVLRVVVPLVMLFGFGAWLERKFNPAGASERQPISDRLPILKRLPALPKISARGALAITFVALLWLGAIGIAIARFYYGLGVVTNLNDQYPWGLWIGFDVVSGVALAAGGFVIAGTVHVFNLKKYHPILRPAILTALLGYLLVIFGLLFDLGRWYNIWHPIFMWNVHSPMLEVAWCVMLYSTVLILEFSPVIFERFKLNWPLKVVRAITIPLVILGVVLSTLHQSSLGSLFLLFPEKMNPLWWSPILPVMFWFSAVCVGLGMVIVESNLSARAFGLALEDDLLKGLAKAASVVLGIYLIIKLADIAMRGALHYAFEPGFHATMFWIEIGLGVITPMVLFAINRVRSHPRAVFTLGGLIVGGVVMNRLNTSLFGWWNYTNGGPIYIPSLGEITITVTLVSVGVVAFGLIAKFFPLFERGHSHA